MLLTLSSSYLYPDFWAVTQRQQALEARLLFDSLSSLPLIIYTPPRHVVWGVKYAVIRLFSFKMPLAAFYDETLCLFSRHAHFQRIHLYTKP